MVFPQDYETYYGRQVEFIYVLVHLNVIENKIQVRIHDALNLSRICKIAIIKRLTECLKIRIQGLFRRNHKSFKSFDSKIDDRFLGWSRHSYGMLNYLFKVLHSIYLQITILLLDALINYISINS